MGSKFPCVKDIEKYLAERYGNWTVPFFRKDGYSLKAQVPIHAFAPIGIIERKNK